MQQFVVSEQDNERPAPWALPRSGTQTLKLCRPGARRGEPGIFSHVRSEKAVDATRGNCAWAYETQNRKGTKVAGNLLHVSNYRTSNNIHTIIGWTTCKTLPSVLVLFWLRHAYVKRYRALRAIHIRVPGEPGNETTEIRGMQFPAKTTMSTRTNLELLLLKKKE